jgi:cbb3-type cytochrome oxidase cytochrome c subunit
MQKNILIAILSFVLIALTANSQKADKFINNKETERIEKFLSSDELQGRQIYS